jgi:uncharacterized protein YukJ
VPLSRYGVLVATAVDRRREGTTDTPHYQIHARAQPPADPTDFRIAVNVLSQEAPSELLYLLDDDLRHPVTGFFAPLAPGWHPLAPRAGTGALDYIRSNLFDRARMRTLPPDAAGPDNDLPDLFEHYVERAIGEPAARIFAFGERWGPETGVPDKVFGFSPGNGVHDTHMNQGNSARFVRDDGPWQDGGLLFHFPGENRWVAVFLAFQSQAWHTDDASGHAIAGGPEPTQPRVRVLAARANPPGPAPEDETVLLLNASPDPVDLTGWTIADRNKARSPVPAGTLAGGDTLVVHLAGGAARLGNKGGQITLLDPAGLKVNGVAYSAADGAREGWTISF